MNTSTQIDITGRKVYDMEIHEVIDGYCAVLHLDMVRKEKVESQVTADLRELLVGLIPYLAYGKSVSPYNQRPGSFGVAVKGATASIANGKLAVGVKEKSFLHITIGMPFHHGFGGEAKYAFAKKHGQAPVYATADQIADSLIERFQAQGVVC